MLSLIRRGQRLTVFSSPNLSSSLQWLRLQAEWRLSSAGVCARPWVLRWPLRSSGAMSCRHHLPPKQRVSCYYLTLQCRNAAWDSFVWFISIMSVSAALMDSHLHAFSYGKLFFPWCFIDHMSVRFCQIFSFFFRPLNCYALLYMGPITLIKSSPMDQMCGHFSFTFKQICTIINHSKITQVIVKLQAINLILK